MDTLTQKGKERYVKLKEKLVKEFDKLDLDTQLLMFSLGPILLILLAVILYEFFIPFLTTLLIIGCFYCIYRALDKRKTRLYEEKVAKHKAEIDEQRRLIDEETKKYYKREEERLAKMREKGFTTDVSTLPKVHHINSSTSFGINKWNN